MGQPDRAHRTVAVTRPPGEAPRELSTQSRVVGVSVKMSPVCRELSKEKLALGRTGKVLIVPKKLMGLPEATTQPVLHCFWLL